MGKKDPPDPPDYQALAAQQAADSAQRTQFQTRANRPNVSTPYGSSRWTLDDTTGQATQDITLNPSAQRALDAQQSVAEDLSGTGSTLTGRVADDLANPVDYSQFRGYGDIGDYDERRNAAEEASYGRAVSRLDPMWDQRTSDIDIKLRNQGLVPGDEAYDRAYANESRARNDAYAIAAQDSIAAGRAESELAFGQQLGEAQFDSTTRQSQIAEELQKRGWTINEINALMSGREVGLPTMPDFKTAGRSATQDFSGAGMRGYQGALDQFNAKQAALQGLYGGITDLAGAGATAYAGR